MKFIYQIIYSFKRILLDYRPLCAKLLSGIIVILILGTAFNSTFEEKNIAAGKILFINDDKGGYGELLLNNISSREEVLNIAEFEEAESLDEAKQQVNQGAAMAVLYFPSDFSKESATKKHVFEVYCKSYSGANKNTDGMLIKNVMGYFVNSLNAVNAVYSINGTTEDMVFSADIIENIPVANPEQTTGMQYYSIAMTLMLIMYGTVYGCMSIAEDYLGTLGSRLKLTTIKPIEQYGGKVAGLSLMVFAEALFLIFFTKFIYGVYWGNNYPLLFAIVITYAVLANSLGAFFTILVKSTEKAEVICISVIMTFTFLAGGFVVMDFGWLKYLSLSHYAKSAINAVVFHGNYDIVYTNLGILWAVILAIAVLSVGIARRKEA